MLVIPRLLWALLSGYDSDRVRRAACNATKCCHRIPIMHYAINSVGLTNASTRINLQEKQFYFEITQSRAFNCNEHYFFSRVYRLCEPTNCQSWQIMSILAIYFILYGRREKTLIIPEFKWFIRLLANVRSVKFQQYWNGSQVMNSMLLLPRSMTVRIGADIGDDTLHKALMCTAEKKEFVKFLCHFLGFVEIFGNLWIIGKLLNSWNLQKFM